MNFAKVRFFTASQLSNPRWQEPFSNDVLERLANGGKLLPRQHAKSMELLERGKGSVVAFNKRFESP